MSKLRHDDTRHMAHALSLGRRGRGTQVAPSPEVGCVIVNAGRVVGRGWTQPGGRPHAEAMALEQAGAAARGATAYVTLEPCAHVSERGPTCSLSLIEAGIIRVVVATGDPDPRTAGQGIARLRAAGIEVLTGVMEADARADMAGYFLLRERDRPWVTLKLAATLDGRIATATGESRWITGPVARRMVHAMRASHDAILVGSGTVRADDPALDVRDMGDIAPPMPMVLSTHLDLPRDFRLLRRAPQNRLLLLHAIDTRADLDFWRQSGARLQGVGTVGRHLDIGAALLGLGVTRLLCEGGGALAASLLAAGLVDEIVMFNAGKLFGATGLPMVADLGIAGIAQAPQFDLVEARAVGDDVLHRWIRQSAHS